MSSLSLDEYRTNLGLLADDERPLEPNFIYLNVSSAIQGRRKEERERGGALNWLKSILGDGGDQLARAKDKRPWKPIKEGEAIKFFM